MPQLIKWFLSVVVLFAVILGSAGIYLATAFDPNNYKTEIQSLVKNQTGFELSISGDLGLSVFPWLGIELTETAVSPSADAKPLAQAERIKLHAKLWPLLSGDVQISAFELQGLDLNLQVDEQGKANWDFGTSPQTSKDAQPSTSQGSQVSAIPLLAFTVGQLSITDSRIHYQDKSQDVDQLLVVEALEASDITTEGSFPLSLKLALTDAKQGLSLPVQLNTDVAISVKQDSLNLNPLTIKLADLPLSGSIQAQNISSNPEASGSFTLAEVIPSQLAKKLQLEGLEAISLPISGDFNFTYTTEALTVKNLNLKTPHGQIKAELNQNLSATNSPFKGSISAAQVNLRKLLPQLGIELPETQNPQALSQVSLTTDISGHANEFIAQPLTLKLDGSTIAGVVGITNIENQEIKADISIDQLDLDAYLPPPAEDEQKSEPEVKGAEAILLPAAALRDINGEIEIDAKNLKASGLDFKDLNLKATGKNGLVTVQNFSSQVNEGLIKANAQINARKEIPTLRIKQSIEGIDSHPTLKSLADIDYVKGKLFFELDATARGATQEELLASLSGTGNYRLDQGQLTNISLENLVCQGIAQIRQQKYLSPEEQAQTLTEFKTFRGDFNLKNGRLLTPDLQIDISNMQARGKGNISLLQQTLDYRFTSTLLGQMDNKACEVNERYRDIAWPILCRGNFDTEPSKLCRLDRDGLEKIITQLARKEIKRKASDELDGKLREKLGDETTDLLKGIFGL